MSAETDPRVCMFCGKRFADVELAARHERERHIDPDPEAAALRKDAEKKGDNLRSVITTRFSNG